MKKIFYDTETCGFHGPIILIQYAINDEEIKLYNVWKEPVQRTLRLIEYFLDNCLIGFNLEFDHFHLAQLYNTLRLLDRGKAPGIQEYAAKEAEARDGLCLKPTSCFDILAHARKGKFQNTMGREGIRLKKIPVVLAEPLAEYLTNKFDLPDILFAKKVDKKRRWTAQKIENYDEFKDVNLLFDPSKKLKDLAEYALEVDETLRFADVDMPKQFKPKEFGYAPFAEAGGNWPEVIQHHIDHWETNALAREYAELDVKYTRDLYKYFDSPEPDDDDSVLACMVGTSRWKGFKIDVEAMEALKENISKKLRDCSVDYNSRDKVYAYLIADMQEDEKLVLKNEEGKITTKGEILTEISEWKIADVCDDCFGEGCDECNEGFVKSDLIHPAAIKAQYILDARHAEKEIQNYDKLLQAGRFHASFNVIGALSSRMSGSDGLNAQGIKREKNIRRCFKLAFDDEILCGGDFSGFEVTLMDAAYNDPDLREELLSGKKIHAIFGQFLFPGNDYDAIKATDGIGGDKDLYSRSKQGVFAMAYGGEAQTLKTRVGIKLEDAENAVSMWNNRFKTFGEERGKIFEKFCSMKQPNGIGTAVKWDTPADYVESLFGFRRYFSLENAICKLLFDLGEKPPKEWLQLEGYVVRRAHKGVQSVSGAVRSALFAAAFAIQAANMRAAGNHLIQSSGATLTKNLQRKIWELQPVGVQPWRVRPFNVHDEIQCVCDNMGTSEEVYKVVTNFVKENQNKVPLLEIEWSKKMASWAEK